MFGMNPQVMNAGITNPAAPQQQQLPWFLRALAGEGDDKAAAAKKLMGFGSQLMATDPRQGFGQRFGQAYLSNDERNQQAEQTAQRSAMMKRREERLGKTEERQMQSDKQAQDARLETLKIQQKQLELAEKRAQREQRGFGQPEAVEGAPGLYQRGPDGQLRPVYQPPAPSLMDQIMMGVAGGNGMAGMGGFGQGAPAPMTPVLDPAAIAAEAMRAKQPAVERLPYVEGQIQRR